MSVPWAFLETKETLLKEAFAVGVYVSSKYPNSFFRNWRDLQRLFLVQEGQRYYSIRDEVRKQFVLGFKNINNIKVEVK